MYILKNALRSVSRSKGRNVLIGLIVFIISFSACVSLSIREASDEAAEDAIEDLKITAQISVDRESMMQDAGSMDERREALSGAENLTLDELEIYADAESVSGFYYTISASLNGNSIEALDMTGIEQKDSTEAMASSSAENGPVSEGGERQENPGGKMGTQGDFTVTGYSADEAMTEFIDGESYISDGEMFAEATEDNMCVINSELASYNDLSVGDEIVLANPNDESETYTLTICGIYENAAESDSASGMMGGFMAGADSSNQIYTSYQTLEGILSQSEDTASEEEQTSIQSVLNGTYCFDSVQDYESFCEEVKELGLSDEYTVSSGDLSAYEESLEPLKNLSEYAGYFLVIIMIIGAAILIVLHIFSIRERKYEIGVLAAIGMKKWKIAIQFLAESLVVTFCALLIGSAAGAVSSVPVTNTLLERQIADSTQNGEERFGREMGMESREMVPMGSEEMQDAGAGGTEGAEEMPQDDKEQEAPGSMMPGFGKASQYISSITSATDVGVILKMMAIGILLTVISGCTALIFIMRYDPLKILSNRD